MIISADDIKNYHQIPLNNDIKTPTFEFSGTTFGKYSQTKL